MAHQQHTKSTSLYQPHDTTRSNRDVNRSNAKFRKLADFVDARFERGQEHQIAFKQDSVVNNFYLTTQLQQQQQQPQTRAFKDDSSAPTTMLSVSSQTQYPWDFVVPLANETWPKPYTDEIQQELKDAYDRQRHLQNIVHSQAQQIRQTKRYSKEAEHAINTMRDIFLMMENEHKIRYTAELELQHKEIELLECRLKRLVNILQTIENTKSSAEETNFEKEALLEDRQRLLRRLRLAELRISARDAEMEYILQRQQFQQTISSPSTKYYNVNTTSIDKDSLSPDINKSVRRSPTPQFNRKGPPYLFQQQYSPKMRSNIRPPAANRHHHQKLSGLDSLGILADQMLSDPDFEHNKASPTINSSPLKQSSTTLSHPQQYNPRESQQEQQTQHTNSTSASPLPSILPDTAATPGLPQSNTQHIADFPGIVDDVPWITQLQGTANDNYEPERYQKRSKRSIDSANALLSIPILSSSFHPISESPEQELDTRNERKKSYNVSNWTPEEDELLRKGVSCYGSAWDTIANTIHDHSPQQCQQRWSVIKTTTSSSITATLPIFHQTPACPSSSSSIPQTSQLSPEQQQRKQLLSPPPPSARSVHQYHTHPSNHTFASHTTY